MMNTTFTHDNIWQLLWTSRCCPPADILHINSAPLQRHIEFCPWCKDALAETRLENIENTFSSTTEFTPTNQHKPSPRAGQIWQVSPQLSGWGDKNRYYNAPLVLILSVSKEGMADVVQLYAERSLMAEDDVQLFADREIFAEPWNGYSMRLEDLGNLYDEVDNSILERCQYAVDQGQSIEIAEASMIWWFRHLEVEVGFHFASQSICKKLNDNQVDNCIADVNRYLNDHNFTRQGLQLSPLSENFLSQLGEWQIPDDRIPLAAADDEQYNCFVVELSAEGTPQNVQFYTFAIEAYETSEDGILIIDGQFPENWDAPQHLYMEYLADGVRIAAQSIEMIDDTLFTAEFAVQEAPQQRPHLSIRGLRIDD